MFLGVMHIYGVTNGQSFAKKKRVSSLSFEKSEAHHRLAANFQANISNLVQAHGTPHPCRSELIDCGGGFSDSEKKCTKIV